jgi:CheY-like chemotaxis protein
VRQGGIRLSARPAFSLGCPFEEGEPLEPSAPPKAKVAVIDDDKFIRYLLDLHLRNAGYQVFAAEDAVAGARMVTECAPDLILCDVEMPFMDGYEFVSALRADPATRSIPVIFLTVSRNAAERAKQLGAGCLTKPLMANELLEAVAAASRRAC